MGQNMKSDWIFALWLQVCTTSNRTANPGAHKNVTCRLYVTTPPVTCGLCNVISNGIIPILELSLHSMGLLVGSWLFCTQTLSMFGKFLVHAWSWCGGLNKVHFIAVQSGSNSF
jgi:hypothetical protein